MHSATPVGSTGMLVTTESGPRRIVDGCQRGESMTNEFCTRRVMMCGSRSLLMWVLALSLTSVPVVAQSQPVPKNDDSHPAVSPDGSQIVFQSRRAGPSDLYLVNSQGGVPRRLTADAGDDVSAAWSPNGDRIAFASDRSGTWQIHLMEVADNLEERAVTRLAAGGREPAFSADGGRIAFVSSVGDVPQVMEVSLADGTVRQLTRSSGAKSQPVFSHDGRLLAYISNATGGQEIYVSGSNGADESRVTDFAEVERGRFINGLGWTPERQLIFAANRDGRGRFFFATDVFTMMPDGKALRRIVSGGVTHNNPSMARDGSLIAFDSFRYGGMDVFVVEADGSNLRNLTATSHMDFFATPTPRGDRVVFQSERGGDRDIYVMNRDGTDLHNLTQHPTDDRAPSVAADGSTIAFASFRDSEWGDIYTMDPGGGNLTKVTPDGFFESLNQFPISTAITPDAKTILFELAPIRVEGAAHWDIWRINRDGTNAMRLTNTSGTGRSSVPAVSPDGETVLYFSNESGNHEIYRMSINGGEVRQLTDHPADDIYPAWSPDGRQIYFTSRRGGSAEVYRMAVDGSDVEQITHGTPPASHFAPAVSAAGDLWVLSNEDGGTYVHRLALDGTDDTRVAAPWGPTSEDHALSAACTDFTRLGQPHWSPTENRIVFPGDCGGRDGVYVYEVDADRLTRLPIELEKPDSPAWSFGGDRIALNAEDEEGERDLYILDLAAGTTTRVTTGGAHGGWVTWSADDEWLNGYGPNAEGTWDVFRVRTDGSARVRVNQRRDANYYTLAQSPVGSDLLYSVRNRIWALKDGGEARPLTPRRIAAVMPRWALDGRQYVFDGNEGFGWNLYVADLTGAMPVPLTQRPEMDGNATWSPDGTTVVYGCRVRKTPTLCLVDVDSRRARPLFLPDR